MPTYREASSVDTSRLAPVGTQPVFARQQNGAAPAPVSPPAAPMEPITAKPLATFDSSLPVIASGSDIYTRQFYNRGGMPQRRFLPMPAARI